MLLLLLLLILLLPILLDDAIGLAVVFDVDVADDAAKPVFAFALEEEEEEEEEEEATTTSVSPR